MIMAGREIILGLEDSPASLAALRWTARYAHATGAVLRAVHVLDWPIGLTASATGPGTRLQVPEEEVALPYRRGMHRVFNEVESHSGWALQFAHGRVPEVLVRLAEEACVLVVGTAADSSEPLPGRLGQPLLHQPRHLPSGHCSSDSRDGQGRALRRLPRTEVSCCLRCSLRRGRGRNIRPAR
jgi:nucleotide-binding universal stress UspA family protein